MRPFDQQAVKGVLQWPHTTAPRSGKSAFKSLRLGARAPPVKRS
ncbi:hypothetical protein [Alcaligenes sp. SDU_A2]